MIALRNEEHSPLKNEFDFPSNMTLDYCVFALNNFATTKMIMDIFEYQGNFTHLLSYCDTGI